ncbi:baseplate J/gp47 family protein [Anaeromassilibacillus senegalensis]|uniref:baseplate J/gp47 family protein n=1 Tax=Anaeromassilibacillus senegalensis TaxID=1673717 RepID=UPI000681D71E|nr:baseplate J/gp47 family protein [Anaeromassilibacillus senegalensis]
MYEEKTYEAIKADILSSMSNELDKREGSYTNDIISPVSLEISKVYESINAVIPIAFVDEVSGEYLERRCAEYGIERKPGTKAKATVTLTGSNGTTVAKGTVLLSMPGLEYLTIAAATIANGTAQVEAEAAEIGSEYNADAGNIDRLASSISGITGVSSGKAEGGTDRETDKALYGRLCDVLQNPSAGGNLYDYKRWAEEVNGVGRAKVLPLNNGPGTVGIIIVDQNMRPVGTEITADCKAHIEDRRPVGAAVTVVSARALTINVLAQVKTDGSVGAAAIKAEFTAAVGKYLDELAFVKNEIVYNRVSYILLGMQGVTDYVTLTVNSGKANISLDTDQVPVLGNVGVTVV